MRYNKVDVILSLILRDKYSNCIVCLVVSTIYIVNFNSLLLIHMKYVDVHSPENLPPMEYAGAL